MAFLLCKPISMVLAVALVAALGVNLFGEGVPGGIRPESISRIVDSSGDIALESHNLSSWVFPHGCVAGLQALKDAAFGIRQNQPEVVSIVTNYLSRGQIQSIFDKGFEFETILRQGDPELIWNVLLSRSKQQASFIDLLILGELYWGDRFSCRLDAPFDAINLNDEPLPRSNWEAHLKNVRWDVLYHGTNVACQLLAVDYYDLWVTDQDKNAFLQNGWSHDNHAIMRAWAKRIQRLPPDGREKIALAALEATRGMQDSNSVLPGKRELVVDMLSQILKQSQYDKIKELRINR